MSAAKRQRGQAAVEVALIWAVFFLHGGWPAPEVNEPNYLGKSKHIWDRSWCPSDLYYTSTDAHLVFHYAFGWLTHWMPLEAFAWCGRVSAWGLLAWGWRSLSVAIVPREWFSVLTAALFVFLQEQCRPAGEWVIGGFEAKVIAYGLVTLGLAKLVQEPGDSSRSQTATGWTWALALMGVASSFHVLVGGWALVAAAFCWLWLPDRPPLKKLWPGLAAGFLLALPGLWLALRLNWGVEPHLVEEANQIYVFQRLPHHLVPERFPLPAVLRQLLLLAGFLALAFRSQTAAERRLVGFVLGSMMIALAGFLIAAVLQSHPVAYAAWMRFYWFRLADVVLPLGAVLLAVRFLADVRWAVARRALLCAAIAIAAWDAVLAAPRFTAEIPRSEQRLSGPRYRDWLAVCQWVEVNTKTDAVFGLPNSALSFKWRSGRSELVNWKEIPQGARATVEYWRRWNWLQRLPEDRTALDELLGNKSPAFWCDYLLIEASGELPLAPVYRNDHYRVYRLERSHE